MPRYELRTPHSMAVGVAMDGRGVDYNRSCEYEADLPGDLDRLCGGGGDRYGPAAVDLLFVCKFLPRVFADRAQPLSAVTGWDVTGRKCGRPVTGPCWLRSTTSARAGSWKTTDSRTGC